MKKLLSLSLVLVLMFTCAAALAENKTGLGIVTSIDSSKPVGEKDGEKTNGTAQVDSTICAVTIDENGVIVSISFDVAQTRVPFTPEGEIAADMTATIRSKMELKDDYNMRRASPIGKEIHEQVGAFEEYCLGKTVEEVLAMPLHDTDSHADVPDGEDLKTSVTISVGEYLKALEKAAANAK